MNRINLKIKNTISLWLRRTNINYIKAKHRGFSKHDEEKIILYIIGQLSISKENQFFVDIGAGDGICASNTFALYSNNWNGLAFECNSNKFAELATLYYNEVPYVMLSNNKVNPENIEYLLKYHQVPKEFGFLSLDIDGYDYFVLDKIMGLYRPSLICTEINERIPPPIKFTVRWDPDYVWPQNHFYGQSISQLYTLCLKYDYALVKYHYVNAFLVPKELNNKWKCLKPEEAYREGYLEKADRKVRYWYNADMEEIFNLSPENAIKFINDYFSKYEGKYLCYL